MPDGVQPPLRPTKDEVFDALVEEILTGDLPPGEPLVERALAKRFGLSRTPIRELLLRLQNERLVDFYPNQGAFVRRLTAKDVRDLFHLRQALEPLAAELAAHNRPEGAAMALLDAFRSVVDAESLAVDELIAYGMRLHDSIADWADNSFLKEMYETVRRHTRLIRSMNRSEEEAELLSFREHSGILEAIVQELPELARDRMLAHLRRANAASLEHLIKGSGPRQ